MSQCKILLENYSGVYYAGSDIRGRLECYFDEETSLRGIKVRLKCKEYNQWMGTETYSDSENKTQTRTISLTGDNNVLYMEQMVYGSEHGSHHLGHGRHVYPFVFSLPYDIPSSFNGPYGNIVYRLKAIVDRPMRFDYEDEFTINVQSPIDLNRASRALQSPTTYSDEKTVCCWCCAGGNITMDVELPKIAYVPGERVPFKIHICNLSNSNVESIKIKLLKTLTFRVTTPHSESKDDVTEIVSFREHGVGAHGEHTFDLDLHIPGDLEVPNFKRCELFSVSYNLQVSSEMPSCTLDLSVSVWDVEFGHVQCSDGIVAQSQGAPVYGDSFEHVSPPGAGFSPGDPAYPPPTGEKTYCPPGFPPGYPPPSGPAPYPNNQGMYPSAPGSSNASAPFDNNPKAREAAMAPSAPTQATPDQPPPSYDQAQEHAKPPYPPAGN